MAKKYYIKTFGCQANEADSERIAGWYENKGWQKEKSPMQADEAVYNSCSVRRSAEDRVIGQIYQLNKYKQETKSKKPKIILTGCMTRLGEIELKKNIPGINAIWPISKFDFKLPIIRQKKDLALIPIMTGCDNFCSYCVVPYARGREESRHLDDIYCEVLQAVKQGYDTVMLLGQNVNSYSKTEKIFSKDPVLQTEINRLFKIYHNSFAVLLALLHQIKELKMIRFLSSNPHDLEDGIIKALALPKIEKDFHLPLQSGSDSILAKMNRKYTGEQYLQIIKKLRQEVKGIRISTDIIVGFPGETEKDFNDTVEIAKKSGFFKSFTAKYSPRPQTAAYKMEDNIPFAVKKQRWQILNELINKNKK